MAEISAKLFKRGFKKYHLVEKKQIILSNFKIFLSQTTLKAYLLTVQAFFGVGRIFFYTWPD